MGKVRFELKSIFSSFYVTDFCHVSFPSKDNADSALTVLNQARLLGNYISAEFASRKASTTSFAKPSSSQQQSRTLYVRNLAFSVDSLALQDHFSKVGKVEKVWIKRDSSGKSMGYAFVDYASEDLAEKALQTLNNTDLKGQLLQVELAKSKPSTAADYASKGIGRNGEILGRGHSKESYKSSRRSDYSHDQQHYHSGSQQSGYGGYDYSSYPPQQYSSHQASAHPEQYGGYSSASHLPGTGSYAPVPAAASYPNYDPNSSTQPPYNSASYYAGYEQQSSRSSSSSIRSQNQNVSGAFGRSRTSRNEEQSRSRFKPY
jgi:RNA recognition motif-containing protein